VRFSKVIAVTLAAGPAGALAAYEKARSSFAPQPPQPDFGQVISWAATGNDWVALGTIALAAVSTGYSIYQMFQPDPATKQDVKDDGRKTREGIEHLSRQGVAETNVLIAKIDALEQKLLAQNPAGAQQIESFATTATDLAESDSAEDRSIAREAVEGDPLAASDRLMAEVEVGVAEQAQRARQAARIAAPFSVAKAITAYARAVELAPEDFGTWIELSRLHEVAGSLPEARRTAEAALQHVGGDWDRMLAEEALGDIAISEGQLPAAHRHYQARLGASQAVLATDPDDTSRQREVSVSHNKLGDVAREEGDLTSARTAYAASLAIRERLAGADPGNAAWQRDLFVSHHRMGRIAEASGDVAGAIAEFEAGEAILVALIARVGDHPGFARDLANVRRDISRLRGEGTPPAHSVTPA
jgi:tetratricopeptide (TPR) repeat protein